MNHVYRLVWNRAMRMWQPVSELAAQPRGGAAPSAVYAPVRWRLHAVAVALGLGLTGWGSAAQAACTAAGLTVTCSGPANPLSPGYSNGASGLGVTLNQGSQLGVLLGVGGTAMRLQSNNVTVTNNGAIDVFALGSGLNILSSGLVLGVPEATAPAFGTYTVNNNIFGTLRGSGDTTYQAQLAGLTGMALSIHNGEGGVTNVTNDGRIEAKALSGGARASADIAAVAIYGGGVTSFNNTTSGTIAGRVAFESAGLSLGNSFTNAGTINGSVSLGANSKNTFVAESGSVISADSQTTGTITVANVSGLLFAAPGTVDGGAGGVNSLIFADTANRGIDTPVAAGTYQNFNSLTVTGGTWSLSGGPVLPGVGNITLNGGMVLLDNTDGLGTIAIGASGGGVGATSAGVSVGNNFMLSLLGLRAGGAYDFTLSGVLSGTGGLTVASPGTVTLTGANNYSGGTTVVSGATVKGDTTSLQGSIVNDGTVIFSSPANGTYAGAMSGTGNLTKQDTGTLTIAGTLLHQGNTAIEAGTLQMASGGLMSPLSRVTLSPNAALDLSSSVATQYINGLAGTGGTVSLGANTLNIQNGVASSFGGVITGTGGLIKSGLSKQTLTGVNTFTGGVTIQSGTLALGSTGRLAAGSIVRIGNGGEFDMSAAATTALGMLNGDIGSAVSLGANTLTLGAGTYDGVIYGTGGLNKDTTASLTLNGVNTYTGATQVNAGTLWVGGSSLNSGARLNSTVTVASGASIGGFGQVNGDVNVQSGASLAPGASGGTFTVNGNLKLAQGSQMNYTFGAPGSAGHSVQVNGNLALNGTQLNVNDAGGFGYGVYRLFDYTGSLLQTNGGITGVQAGQTVQYRSDVKQINLINSGNLVLNIWNANGLATPTQFGGGSGTWSSNSATWTVTTAALTSIFTPSNGFAIFAGAPGTVTVDASQGSIGANGVQFAADGYRMNGDALNLVAPSAGLLTEVRVGDGSAPSAGWTATLDNTLAGNGLNKTGAGTLVLNGANTYAQTQLSAGTLSVSSDANLGAALGGLDFQGGTLRVTGTAFQNTARAITLGAAGGGLDIADAANTFTVSQSLWGIGGLNKLGAGTRC